MPVPVPSTLSLFRTVALLAAAALTSCAHLPISRNEPSDEPWTNYVIGQAQSASTGSTMIEWIGRARILRGYRLVTPLKVARLGRQPPTDAGVWPAYYRYNGSCRNGRYVITNEKFYRDGEVGIIVAEDGTIPCEASVIQLTGVKRGRQWLTPEAVGTRAFVPAPVLADLKEAPIRWELVYSGRAGNEIGLAYREYASVPGGELARPAFYQELKYDLSASNRVVFRTLEVEVTEASNVGITFRVLRDEERSGPQEPATNLVPRGP